ncbi:hypothetical protein F1880_003608 [Penicillium rolfsii]|nr:hypothetical protein F1880_003608 [Penicillium rolfsii]
MSDGLVREEPQTLFSLTRQPSSSLRLIHFSPNPVLFHHRVFPSQRFGVEHFREGNTFFLRRFIITTHDLLQLPSSATSLSSSPRADNEYFQRLRHFKPRLKRLSTPGFKLRSVAQASATVIPSPHVASSPTPLFLPRRFRYKYHAY